MNPKVSIIIPVYKTEKYLERCLHSLLNQTLSEIEIILVDDESPDNCPLLCDSAAKKDSRIKVIHKKNAGAGYARNAGLEIASGEYIGFVDSDDYVDLRMYENLYNAAEKYSADFVLSGVCFVDGNMFAKDGERIEKNYFDEDTIFESEDDIKKLLLGVVGALPEEPDDSRYGMSVWKNLFRRDIIEKNALKFLSEREIMTEDALFMMDFIPCIKKAVGVKGAYYNYCRNEDSISKAYKEDRLEKSIVFLNEVEKRLKLHIPEESYRIYLDRFTQAFARVICSQEIMYAEDNKIGYSVLRKRLKRVCTSENTVNALKNYPWYKLPVKQAIFAFSVKYRLFLLQKILVILRQR